jgi:hypothetical protein
MTPDQLWSSLTTKAVCITTYLGGEQGWGGTVTVLLRAMQGVFTMLHNDRQSFRLLALTKSAATVYEIPILSEGLNKLDAIQNSVTKITS